MTLNAQQNLEIKLWEANTPGTKGDSVTDVPVMYYFAGEKENRRAVVKCPGGGYTHLAIEKEGYALGSMSEA